jgi:hypothetical protein
LAFDGDFREQFNDKLHGGKGSLASPVGLLGKKYSSPHLRLHPGAEVYHHRSVPVYFA